MAEERVDLLTGCPLFVEEGVEFLSPEMEGVFVVVVVAVNIEGECLGGAETGFCESRYPCLVQVVLLFLSTVVVKLFKLMLTGCALVVMLGRCAVIVDVATDSVDMGEDG